MSAGALAFTGWLDAFVENTWHGEDVKYDGFAESGDDQEEPAGFCWGLRIISP